MDKIIIIVIKWVEKLPQRFNRWVMAIMEDLVVVHLDGVTVVPVVVVDILVAALDITPVKQPVVVVIL